jgi:uncharacterized repeat protein (TIGR03806 family)
LGRARRLGVIFALVSVWIFSACAAVAQTAFLNFNMVGQYTNNFSPWNDNGLGTNNSNYSFEENATDGVGGSGGVAVFQDNNMTATYNAGSWNISTNGATALVSVLIYADGESGTDKLQLGFINTTTNGLDNNPGVAFESYRIVPSNPTNWPVREQYRTNNTTINPGIFGSVVVTVGHWYKFVVGVTNTSGSSGNVRAGCALFDYGTNGLTPGTNLITFSTAVNHPAQNFATNTAVWPALYAVEDAGVSAWDNFLVYTANSAPVITSPLTNVMALINSTVTFTALADGPGSISYSWYTNNALVAGASSNTYTLAGASVSLTNIAVVASNANGSSTNQAVVTAITPMSPLVLTGFNLDLVIESNAVGPPYLGYAQEYNQGGGSCFYQHGLPGTTNGLPGSGVFNSVIDLTQFEFAPYTAGNALVMSSDTGITNGTLTLLNPAIFSSIAVLANSANGTSTSTGELTLNFADGSTFLTNYNAADWFSTNGGFALQGVDSIDITNGVTQGSPAYPRFYETTINLAELGLTNEALNSLTFGEASGVGATAVFAVSGLVSGNNAFTLAMVTNASATQIQSTSALLAGGVASTGGYVPTISIFYGTTDGGTNAAAWSNSVSLGYESGAFSQTVANLAPATTYYFSAQASTISGVSWAKPVELFTTPGLPGASVINLPAANVTATSATLAADILSSYGGTPLLTIFCGTNDGGTNVAGWESSISLGLENGFAAVTVPSLVSNTTYYFTAQASNSLGVAWGVPSLSFTTLESNPVSSVVSMLTYHNDNARDGVNSNETQLTLANVNTNTFGKLFSYNVDGYVYAQPLVMTNVIIPGKGLHNVVYVATENNSVYAFDADSNEGPNAGPLWQVSFINPAAGVTVVPSADVSSSDLGPEIGITATPVIDPSTGTLYVEVRTKEVSGTNISYMHRLHALDITTGAERVGGAVSNSPAIIAATNYPGLGDGDNDGNGHVLWNGLRQHNRCALTLLNGAVYIGYASIGDYNPYHGWLFSYSAQNMAQLSVYNTTPNGLRGGLWQGGGGATVDEAGNFYFLTGNGSVATDFNATNATFSQATNNFAMSALKFTPTNDVPTLVDFFTPHDQAASTASDGDLGAGGALVLPDSAGSTNHPHLLAAAGKGGKIYLIDRDNMGHFNASSDSQIVQVERGLVDGSYMTPAFFNQTIFYIGQNSSLKAFGVSNAVITANAISQSSTVFGTGGSSSPSISANGSSSAIIWVTECDAAVSGGPAILHAYNATNLSQEIYNSSMLFARDNPGNAVKFAVPTVVNGKVYVGSEYVLSVFGLGAFLPTPAIQPNGGFFTNQVLISFSDATAGASFYYTLDGTTPTTNSLLYTAPFELTHSATVQVIASAGGGVSGIGSASFINSAAAGNGIGLLGSYFSNQVATFIPPPTLVRTDAVIDFNWGGTAPDPSIGSTNFSVKWTGFVQPQYTETYTFYTLTDGGAQLWINGQLLINAFTNQPPTQWSATIPMVAQQSYNIEMDYFYQNTGASVAQLFWSSSSTPFSIIPQSQLFPFTNAPPVVMMNSPSNGAVLTADATVTLGADAAAGSNAISQVAFYVNGQLFGAATNPPYSLTDTGLTAGSYILTAVASDTTGLMATSAPVDITVNPGTGLPYGISNYSSAPAFYNMPPVFTGPMPTLLSETGVFTNTPDMDPAPSLIPYAPNVQLYSDNAQKIRYFSVPNTGVPYTPDEQISYAPTNTWSFPSGTVFVKTFELQTNLSDPASLLRLETRLLVRDANGGVYGVTYKWRSDYSDADLQTNSSTEPITIQTTNGVYTNLWYYPSPSDCLQCHTLVGNYVLGVNTRQLNGNLTYSNGVTDNQLRALNRAGLFYPAIDEPGITNLDQLSAATNASVSLLQRARSYLDANCAQCHQPGGPGPTFDARYDTLLTNQNIIDTPAIKGNFGYDNVNIVTPNDVWRSSLYNRMNVVNPAIQMPPLARNLVDTNAVQLMADWINSMGATPALPPPTLMPFGGTFQGSVSVTLQDSATNAELYYTLDGSLPTTNSLLYDGSFLLTNSVTINANAWEIDYIQSVVGMAQFTILPNPLFTGAGGFTNSTFQMSFIGPIGSNYVLQVSPDLMQWTSISTNTPTNSPFVLIDTNAPSSTAQFYRVLQEP